MHVHLTCQHPRRSLVIALSAVRELLRRSGHRVSVSWPESWEEADGKRRIGLCTESLTRADIIVHCALASEGDLPPEVTAAGRPVVRYEPGSRIDGAEPGGAVLAVTRAEDVPDAVARAAAESVRLSD